MCVCVHIYVYIERSIHIYTHAYIYIYIDVCVYARPIILILRLYVNSCLWAEYVFNISKLKSGNNPEYLDRYINTMVCKSYNNFVFPMLVNYNITNIFKL